MNLSFEARVGILATGKVLHTPTLHWCYCCVSRWLTLHIVLRVVVIYLPLLLSNCPSITVYTVGLTLSLPHSQ